MDKKQAFLGRIKHAPDDPARAELRAALRELSQALMPLHRALINAARDDYEAGGLGMITGATHLLRLLQEDPFFGWLQPMTSLIVDIDEIVRADFQGEDAMAITRRADMLFGTCVDPGFADRYLQVLQRDVDVAAGHAAVRLRLARLPRQA